MAIVLGATALIGGASALYFRATMTQNHEEYVEARVFAPPSSWFEATTLVAEAVRLLSREIRAWRPDDLTLGVNRLGKREVTDELARELAASGASKMTSAYGRLLRQYDNLLALCFAVAHGRTIARVAELAGIEESAVLASQLYALTLRPAYSLVRDDASRSLVLVLRGTHSLRDTLTCLTAATQPHHALPEAIGLPPDSPPVLGFAHSGFLTAARWLLAQTFAAIKDAVEAHPGFSLTITGHSMGAGAAVLLTMMLRERPVTAHATCVAFACPAVLTKELAEVCVPFVTSVLTGCDIVPTASAGAVTCLREEMRAARRQAMAERGGPLIDRAALAKLVGDGLRMVSRPGQQCTAQKYRLEAEGEDDAGKPIPKGAAAGGPQRGGSQVQNWLSASAASITCRCWAAPGSQPREFDSLEAMTLRAAESSSSFADSVSLVPPSVEGLADWRGARSGRDISAADEAEVLIRDGGRVASSSALRASLSRAGSRRHLAAAAEPGTSSWVSDTDAAAAADGGGVNGGGDAPALEEGNLGDVSADWDPETDADMGFEGIQDILAVEETLISEAELEAVQLMEQSGSEDGDVDDDDEGQQALWAQRRAEEASGDEAVGVAGAGAEGDAQGTSQQARRRVRTNAGAGGESAGAEQPTQQPQHAAAAAAQRLHAAGAASVSGAAFAPSSSQQQPGGAGAAQAGTSAAAAAAAEQAGAGSTPRSRKHRPKVLFPAGRILHVVWDTTEPVRTPSKEPPPQPPAGAAPSSGERDVAGSSGAAAASAAAAAAAASVSDGAAAFAASFGLSWGGAGAGSRGGNGEASSSSAAAAAAERSHAGGGEASSSANAGGSSSLQRSSSTAAMALERAPPRKRHVRMEPLARLERLERRHKPPWRLPGANGRWVMYSDVPHERYGKLLLSRRMVLDHYIPTQADALWGVMAELGVDV